MTPLDTLQQLFTRFPGIGPSQARRFVYHLLTASKSEIASLSELIGAIQNTVTECPSCARFYARYGTATMCEICSNTTRDKSKLLVVERDHDITPIERAGAYEGYYFVLGGTIPLIDEREGGALRSGQLKALVETRSDTLGEIILAFSVNPDGENTARYIQNLLHEQSAQHNITISTLGRGLSTGSELEYADPETIKNALRNRH